MKQRDKFWKGIDDLDRRIASDPIDALALLYVDGRGIVSTSDPVITVADEQVETECAAVLVPDRVPAPSVVLHDAAGVRLTLLDLRVAPFGVVAAFGVETSENVKLDVLRKADPTKSPLFLVDRASGAYLYPRATTLPGVAVARVPTIGLVLFDPVRAPAAALDVHAVNLRLGTESATFVHTYAPPWLGYESETALRAPSVHNLTVTRLAEYEAARVDSLAAEARRKADENRARNSRNFKIAIIVIGALVLLAALGQCLAPDDSAPAKPQAPRPTPTQPKPAKGGASATPRR
jgi:hypothetical protein